MAFGFGRKFSKGTGPNETTTALRSPLSSVDATNRSQDGSAIPAQAIEKIIGVSVDDIFAGDEAAKAASDHELQMTMSYTIRYYRPAILWAAIMAAPIILEGYETALVPNFFSFTSFQKRYGIPNPEKPNQNVIPTGWQSGITIAAAMGQLVGLSIAPGLVNRFGYRVCTLAGFLWASICLMVTFSSTSLGPKLPVFLVGEMLLGLPWGLLQGLTLPYVSDITPLTLKGPATTVINVFWLLGQLISAGVLRGSSEMKSSLWAIRIPMLLQYTWIFVLAALVYFAPESPMYLSRCSKDAEAIEALKRINKDPHFNEQGSLAMIRAVNDHEKETAEKMGLSCCFKGSHLRRTEIAVVVYLTQQLVGSPLVFYSVKVLEKGGLTQSSSLFATIGMYSLCILSTFGSMATMRSVGRRTMWICGLGAEVFCLTVIGVLGFYESRYVAWGITGLLILFACIYNFTIGPLCYAIVAETPSMRLKAATNSVARCLYIALSIANLFLVPNLLEDKPMGWGLGARAALVWAGTSTLCLAWAWFRLPEMKGRSPAQIDVLFEKRVPARKWSAQL